MMANRNSWVIALRALRKNKLQTALAMIGMTIGVATVLTMIALGTGAQTAIQDQVRAAGMNMIIVTAGNYQIKQDMESESAIEPSSWTMKRRSPFVFRSAVYRSDEGVRLMGVHAEDDPMVQHDHPTAAQRLGDAEAGLGAAATLTLSDGDAIRKLNGVQYVSEGVHLNSHVVFGSKRWITSIHGDGTEISMIRRAWVFSRGRFFTKREEAKSQQVVVLGSLVSQKLFGDANPVGKNISLWNQPFKVVGVVNSGSYLVRPSTGDDQFDAVYIPVTTIQRLLDLSKLNDITITTLSTGAVTAVSKEITDLLRVRHKISATMADDFTVTSQERQALASGGMQPEVQRAVTGNAAGLEKVTLEQLGKTLDRASATMTALLASIAAVSLIVGGIGIMNIMLLSVTERTREIGIRRSVGARAKDVLTQFLLESVALSVTGGLLGILIGYIAALAISSSIRWSTTISPLAVILSFGVSAAVGIFFGYYPARQASQVAPLTALRYE
jgi:putative ABC transport system permease protein